MNTAQRTQSRAKRYQADPMALPKFWRPKITPAQQLDAKLVHWDLITRFTDGSADAETLWDWIETGYTYSQIMRMHAEDGTSFTDEAMNAIAEQLAIYPAVIARYGATKRAAFTGPELNIARAAGYVMDGLLEIDRHGIAERAARWSIEQMTKLRRMQAGDVLEVVQ